MMGGDAFVILCYLAHEATYIPTSMRDALLCHSLHLSSGASGADYPSLSSRAWIPRSSSASTDGGFWTGVGFSVTLASLTATGFRGRTGRPAGRFEGVTSAFGGLAGGAFER